MLQALAGCPVECGGPLNPAPALRTLWGQDSAEQARDPESAEAPETEED